MTSRPSRLRSASRHLPMTQVSDIQDVYRLTPMQQGLLVKGLAAPASARGYVVQWRGTLRQATHIDPEALERAYQYVVERHTMLRTCVVWEGLDEPVQVVRQNVRPSIVWLDWRALTPDQQQRRLETWLRDDAEQGFDLRKAPLMRMTVIRFT